MRPVYSLLFAVGIIVAISGAAKLPDDGATFPDSWPVFAGAFLVALVEVQFWWGDVLSERKELRLSHDSDSVGSPTSLMTRLLPELDRLNADLDDLDAEQLTERIDELLDGYVLPLVESRQKLIDQFGMSVGAEILVTVAFGERMLNRVWSAAADGHLPEAQSSFRDAADAFKQAQTIACDAATAA